MDAEELLWRKRLSELADKAYSNSQYVFTGFLTAAELDVYYQSCPMSQSPYLAGLRTASA